MSTRSLVLLYPGAVSFEIMLAIEVLGSVDVVTSDGRDHTDASGLTIAPTVDLAAWVAAEYDVVLVPGGNPDSIAGDAAIRSLITAAADRRATIGGICAGLVVLADAGVLAGRRITHNYGPEDAPPEIVAATAHFWTNTVVSGDPCVVDRQEGASTIVTAKPFAFIEFATALGVAAGRFDRAEADDRNRYYRGRL